MADGATFDFRIDTMIFNAVPISAGRASGTSITWTRTRADFSMDTGIGGIGYYTFTDDLSSTITLVLQPNADEHAVLQAALAADRLTPNGLLVPISLIRGLTIIAGLGRAQGPPSIEWSDTTMPTTWTILSTRMVGTIGGKPPTPVAG